MSQSMGATFCRIVCLKVFEAGINENAGVSLLSGCNTVNIAVRHCSPFNAVGR